MIVPMILATLCVLGCVSTWGLAHDRFPYSLSEVATKGKVWKYLLASVLFLFSGGIWVACIDRIPDNWQWLLFLTSVGLIFVAVSPITNSSALKVHYTAAIITCVAITLLVYLMKPVLLLLWAIYVSYTLFTDGKYKKLIAESVCALQLVLMILFL